MESHNAPPSVRVHLELLRAEHARLARQDHLYVTLAYVRGTEVEEISRLSGLRIDRVRRIILSRS